MDESNGAETQTPAGGKAAPGRIARLRLMARVAGAVALAAITMLALLEVGLRLAEWWSLRARGPAGPSAAGTQTILCLGDSWTFGHESGDPARLSYPAQLHQALQSLAGPGGYRVVNEGIPGATSTHLLSKTPALLRRYQPRVVILLVGGLNWIFDSRPAEGGSTRALALGPGLLDKLKVMRLLRMVLGPRAFEPPRAVKARNELLRAQLRSVLALDGARLLSPGRPPSPLKGCDEEQRDYLARLDRHEAAEVEPLKRARHSGTRCAGLAVVVAEQCLADRHHDCALEMARLGRQLAGPHPRAVVALALARKGPETVWPAQSLDELERIRMAHPRYLEPYYHLLAAEVETDVNLCSIKALAGAATAQCSGCPWAKSALEIADRGLDPQAGRVFWEQHNRRLWSDLAAIEALVRGHGASLLLLGYAPTALSPCRRMSGEVTAKLAAARSIPYLDLGNVLTSETGGGSAQGTGGDYAGGGHPSAAGYRKIAIAVEERLFELGWVTAIGGEAGAPQPVSEGQTLVSPSQPGARAAKLQSTNATTRSRGLASSGQSSIAW